MASCALRTRKPVRDAEIINGHIGRRICTIEHHMSVESRERDKGEEEGDVRV